MREWRAGGGRGGRGNADRLLKAAEVGFYTDQLRKNKRVNRHFLIHCGESRTQSREGEKIAFSGRSLAFPISDKRIAAVV